MPNPQPEEDAAQWRRRRAIRRVDPFPRDGHLFPDPGRGVARGYPILLRRKLILRVCRLHRKQFSRRPNIYRMGRGGRPS